MLGQLCLPCCAGRRQKLEAKLNELAEALVERPDEPDSRRALRIGEILRPALEAELQVDGPLLLPGTYSYDQVLSALVLLPGHRIGALRLNDVDVRFLDSGDGALATGNAQLSESDPSDPHSSRIRFDAHLRDRKNRWVFERVWLDSPRIDLPEARP